MPVISDFNRMTREQSLDALATTQTWDLLIVGGGATGVATALDAAARGLKTLLIEKYDFGKGTSSRSTKLVHGGVRYLQQGNLALVMEALRERGLLRKNAPHLVHSVGFLLPVYHWFDAIFYGIGLRIYDLLARRYSFGSSRNLSRTETLRLLPTASAKGLRGSVLYYDGQFDDARLLINMVQTAQEQGACALNYMEGVGFMHKDGVLDAAVLQDRETGKQYTVQAKAFVNATGPFTDTVRSMDEKSCTPMVSLSQGIHLVLPRRFLPGDYALMVPKTDDGRVMFAIPWHQHVVLGTTDSPITTADIEPRPLAEEIEFLMSHAARYLTEAPKPGDVLSVFTGIRPLVKKSSTRKTSTLSRDHTIHFSESGLLTVCGGKWTTCRHMGEDVVNQLIKTGRIRAGHSVTSEMPLHGAASVNVEAEYRLRVYGSDASAIAALEKTDGLNELIHPEIQATKGQVIWAIRNESARTVDDILSRRTRAVFLNSRAAKEAAPMVAELIAMELGRDETWIRNQVAEFNEIAEAFTF